MSDAGKSKVISESIFTDSKIRNLPLVCKVMFLDWIVGEQFNKHGVASVFTGNMERFVHDDVSLYCQNNWKKFKEEFPERSTKTDFTCRVYPFLDIMEDAGLIKYDRPTHTLLIKNYHRYVKFQEKFGIDPMCDSLSKTCVSVGAHHFFDEYLSEIKNRVITLVDAEIDKFAKKQELYQLKHSGELEKYDEDELKKFEKKWNKLKTCSDLETKYPKLLEKLNEMRCPKKSPIPCKNENLIDSVRGRPVAAR